MTQPWRPARALNSTLDLQLGLPVLLLEGVHGLEAAEAGLLDSRDVSFLLLTALGILLLQAVHEFFEVRLKLGDRGLLLLDHLLALGGAETLELLDLRLARLVAELQLRWAAAGAQ